MPATLPTLLSLAAFLPSAIAHEPEGGHAREQDLCNAAALERLATETHHNASAGGLLTTTHRLLDVDTLDTEGVVLRKGDEVRTKSRAGTAKPWSTGHAHEVDIGPGKTGRVVCFTDSQIGEFHNELAVIRWDLQVWKAVKGTPAQLVLQPFESTINPSYLEVMPAAKATPAP